MDRFLYTAAVVIFLMPSVCFAQISMEDMEFFETKIRPVLTENCGTCHGSRRPKSGLRLSERVFVLRGGKSGQPAIVPGDPENSRLIHAIRRTDPEFQMPPEEALSQEAIDDLTRWVAMGAPWPSAGPGDVSEPGKLPGRDLWSFKPRGNPQPPAVKNVDWVQTPLDNFILAKLEDQGLTPADPAGKAMLIRRATYDLIGLPPTPEETQSFLDDESPDAYETLVERLLASHHYGERWGRHWLDLARYADTTGNATDHPVPEAYKYRNYVIDSFNEDLPYDEFVVEQLAGDIQAFSNPEERFRERIIATGFLALSPQHKTFKNTDTHIVVENVIDTVGKAMLGLSLRCARCHSHKFDPISQMDYYAAYGFFGNARYPHAGSDDSRPREDFVALVGDREYSNGQYDKAYEERYQLRLELAKHELQRDDLLKHKPEALDDDMAGIASFIGLLKRTKQDYVLESEDVDTEEGDEEGNKERQDALSLAAEKLDAVQEELMAHYREKREEIDGTIAELTKKLEPYDYLDDIELAWAVVDKYQPMVDEPIHLRGDPRKLGDQAPRGFIRAITPEDPVIPEGQSGRLQFAEWVASPDNPLTARVMANRIWQYHFGTGIVSTPNTFGNQGVKPTHPALLDWLANRFVEKGWSVKAMHREIMLSSSYRMSSDASDEQLAGDPSNTLFSRFPRQRLDYESLRDTLLAVGNRLDLTPQEAHPFPDHVGLRTLFGEGNPFTIDYPHNYRSVYLMARRLSKRPFYQMFDGPDTKRSVAKRGTATLPQQALFMMNSPFVKESSEAFADRLFSESETDADRVQLAYKVAYARDPSAAELDRALVYVRGAEDMPAEEAWASFCQILLMSNEFMFVD
jgi:hypothetical protein